MCLKTNAKLKLGFLNLHDAFLNASLQRKYMHNCPIEENASNFLVSDRGRFERAWVAFLFVLVEAWLSNNTAEIRNQMSKLTDIAEVDLLLKQAKKNGLYDKMRDTRHYMCHRDKREYWDDGRMGPIGNLEFNEKLHMAYSKIFLKVFNKMKEERLMGGE